MKLELFDQCFEASPYWIELRMKIKSCALSVMSVSRSLLT